MALTDKLTAIANAIRAKTGETGKMTLEQMPAKIGAISGGGGGGFDTSQITTTISMFEYSEAGSIDVSGLDVSNVHVMDRMFAGCQNIKSLDLSSLNVQEYMFRANGMFDGCTNLEVLDISSLSNLEACDRFISDCGSLSVIKIGKDSDTEPIFCYFAKDNEPSGYPTDFQIQVPAHLVDAYKADSSWADYADQIVARP